MVTHTELERFLDAVPSHVLVVVDEAYVEFVTGEDAPRSLELYRDRPNVMVLRTFSKAYGLAGLRVGYAVAHPPVAAALRKTAVPFGVNSIAQAAAVASLAAFDELKERVDALVARAHPGRRGAARPGVVHPRHAGELRLVRAGRALRRVRRRRPGGRADAAAVRQRRGPRHHRRDRRQRHPHPRGRRVPPLLARPRAAAGHDGRQTGRHGRHLAPPVPRPPGPLRPHALPQGRPERAATACRLARPVAQLRRRQAVRDASARSCGGPSTSASPTSTSPTTTGRPTAPRRPTSAATWPPTSSPTATSSSSAPRPAGTCGRGPTATAARASTSSPASTRRSSAPAWTTSTSSTATGPTPTPRSRRRWGRSRPSSSRARRCMPGSPATAPSSPPAPLTCSRRWASRCSSTSPRTRW